MAATETRNASGNVPEPRSVNVEFKDKLLKMDIPVDWVSVPDVAHDTKGLYRRVGVESLKFMKRNFPAASR